MRTLPLASTWDRRLRVLPAGVRRLDVTMDQYLVETPQDRLCNIIAILASSAIFGPPA